MALRLVVLCALLVTAGCAGSLLPDGAPGAPSNGDGGDVGAAPTTASPVVAARNPWRSAEVVVAVDDRSGSNLSYVPLVEAAVAYWNGPGREFATYPATFRVVPAAEDPDVVVVVRDGVTCDEHEDVLGCAPRLSADDRPPRPVVVEVAAGFSDATTRTAVEHEFGHVLGIDHGEPPLPLMEARHAAATLPATDAVDRANPWRTDDLRVYADLAGASGDEATLRFQLRQAVAYYDDGAEGTVPANLSVSLVDDPAEAQIHVAFDRDAADCPADASRSCGSWVGYDPDGDGALEYYTNATIVLNGIDDAAVGWHVGYWLGVVLGHDRDEERAPPFRDASPEERRSDWWA